MITVNYTRNGFSVSDFEVDNFVDFELSKHLENATYETSSISIVDAFLLAAMSGRIEDKNIQFRREGELVEFCKVRGFYDAPRIMGMYADRIMNIIKVGLDNMKCKTN